MGIKDLRGQRFGRLTVVEFAEGSQLKTIGKQAFYGTGLTEIVFPEGLESIGDAAFRDSSANSGSVSLKFR